METSVCLAEYLSPAAHMVVIKDVKIFQNGVSQEYSDLDITQMIGRAVSLTRLNIMCDNTRVLSLTRDDPSLVGPV